jgi:hypothetical protein
MASNLSDDSVASLKAKVAKLQERQATSDKLASECDRARKEYDKANKAYRRLLGVKGKRPGRPPEWLGLKGFDLAFTIEAILNKYVKHNGGKRPSDGWAIGELVKRKPWAKYQGKEKQRELAARLVRARERFLILLPTNPKPYWKLWDSKWTAREQALARYEAAVTALTAFYDSK